MHKIVLAFAEDVIKEDGECASGPPVAVSFRVQLLHADLNVTLPLPSICVIDVADIGATTPVLSALWSRPETVANVLLTKRIVHLLTASFPSVLRFVKVAKTRESKEIWDAYMAFITTINTDVTTTGRGGAVARDALTKLLETVAKTCNPAKVRPCTPTRAVLVVSSLSRE